MLKTEKTKCPKCRKKVDAEIKAEGELICPVCSKSLGFVFATEKNLLIEMVQVYLDYKKIHAVATINEDGHLDIQIDMNNEDQQALADLLSKCMPISYIITNTAVETYRAIGEQDRRAGKRTSTNIGKRKKGRVPIKKQRSKTKSGKWRKKNPNNLERFF